MARFLGGAVAWSSSLLWLLLSSYCIASLRGTSWRQTAAGECGKPAPLPTQMPPQLLGLLREAGV